MGIFLVLTSALLVFSSSAETVKKHRRTEGVQPPSKSQTPLPPRGKAAGKGGENTSKKPNGPPADQPAACPTGLALDRLFQFPQAHRPAAIPDGVYYLRTTGPEAELVFQRTALQPAAPVSHLEKLDGFASSESGKLALHTEEGATSSAWILDQPVGTPRRVPLASKVHAGHAVWGGDLFLVGRTAEGASHLLRWDLTSPATQTKAELNTPLEVADVFGAGDKTVLRSAEGELFLWEATTGKLSPAGQTAAGSAVFFSRSGKNLLSLSATPAGAPRLQTAAWQTGKAPRPLSLPGLKIRDFRIDPKREHLVAVIEERFGETRFMAWRLGENGSLISPLAVPRAAGETREPVALLPAQGKQVRFFFTRSGTLLPSLLWFWDGIRENLWTGVHESLAFGAGCWNAGISGGDHWAYSAGDQAPHVLFIGETAAAFEPAVAYLVRRGFSVTRIAPDVSTGVWARSAREKDETGSLFWVATGGGASRISGISAPEQALFDTGCALSAQPTLSEVRECVEKLETAAKKKGPPKGP
ncbi:hypothetical protein K2X33_09315 [bacterium]|nr:hypothetical protein [bacterium]